MPFRSRLPVTRLVPAAVCLMLTSLTADCDDADGVLWSRDVAPLLQTYCAGCHNSADDSGGFSVQSPGELLAGSDNGPVLDRDEPAAGRLFEVLQANDDSQMPPADEPQLSSTEQELLLTWIRGGAEFDVTGPQMLNVPDIPSLAEEPVRPIRAVLPVDDATVVTATFGQIEFRDARSLEVQRTIPVGPLKIVDLDYDPIRGELLIATGVPGISGSAIAFSARNGERLREYGGHGDLVYAVACSPDGQFVASAGYDRVIHIFDRTTGERQHSLTGHNGAVFDLAFSPDSTLLASASADATGKVWHVASGQRLDTLSQPLSEQHAVAFSADGNQILIAGADHRIRSYELLSRNTVTINPLRLARFAHEQPVNQLSVSADGRLLATASDDQTVKIWDPDRIRQLALIRTEAARVTCLAFTPDSQEILTGLSDGRLIRHPVTGLSESGVGVRPLASTDWTKPPEFAVSGGKDVQSVTEQEPNNSAASANPLQVPAVASGTIASPSGHEADRDCFSFEATAGQPVCIDVRAARDKSPLDSFIEVVTTDGQPILRTLLQAQRDSWFTFRGKDATTSDDFRMFNWQEMELNEFLYADGEVVRLWLYPRGPDSGFKVYPGYGARHTYFGTTPTAHALQAPAFIVRPLAPDSAVIENGLPVFRIYCQNDDDPLREWGSDSRLIFRSPHSGQFVVRLRDARGFGGDDFAYQLSVRPAEPDFSVSLAGAKQTVYRGTGRELVFTAKRIDGFDGPIEITAANLPPGFVLSAPIIIQRDQMQASATLFAQPDAVQPAADIVQQIRFEATAVIYGETVRHGAGAMSEIQLADEPKLRIRISDRPPAAAEAVAPVPELTLHPGETTRAWVQVDRSNHTGAISFGKEDAGRNLPHGVFVDNIGLNGLLIPAGQDLREVFITAADWVPECSHPFHLKAAVDGGLTTLPVILHVRHRSKRNVTDTDTE